MIVPLLAIICIVQLVVNIVLGLYIWKSKLLFDRRYTDKLIINKLLSDYIKSETRSETRSETKK